MPLFKRLISRLLAKLSHSQGHSEFALLERRIGYRFRNVDLLRMALTHPSCKSRNAKQRDYQRLEFLGDAVLGLIFAEMLYADTDADEGALTEARTQLVRGSNLAAVARKLELGAFLRLPGNAGDNNRIRASDTANEDALEALFGAVFLDGRLNAARRMALALFADQVRVDSHRMEHDRSPKNRLQELVQRDGRSSNGTRIQYHTVNETGTAHARRFVVEVCVDGVCRGRGAGSTKRAAGEAAALGALQDLRRMDGKK